MWIELYAKKIPLAPVAMGRPRRGAHGMYTPPKSRQYLKKLVAILQGPHYDTKSPIRLQCMFVHPRPKRLGKGGQVPKQTKPDLDNLIKMLLDGIVSANLIPDDNQVTLIAPLPGATHMDLYAAHGEDPHTLLTISIWSTDAKTQPTHETITI